MPKVATNTHTHAHTHTHTHTHTHGLWTHVGCREGTSATQCAKALLLSCTHPLRTEGGRGSKPDRRSLMPSCAPQPLATTPGVLVRS